MGLPTGSMEENELPTAWATAYLVIPGGLFSTYAVCAKKCYFDTYLTKESEKETEQCR